MIVPPTAVTNGLDAGIVGSREAEDVEVVAVVAGGELDGHPGRVGEHEQVVPCGPGRDVVQEISAGVAP